MHDRIVDAVPHKAAEELTKAQQEKQELAQQVKQLIKSESKLYEIQEELDVQLKEYKDLLELSKKLSTTFDIRKIFKYTLEYIIYTLQYERALILQPGGPADSFIVRAFDGYYSEKEKRGVESLALNHDDSLLSLLQAGAEYLVCQAGPERKLFDEYRAKLQLDEYLICALGSYSQPLALLIVGNSGENAMFHRRVIYNDGALLGIGNLVGLLSSSLENHASYTSMEKALEQERLAQEAVRALYAELEKKNDELKMALEMKSHLAAIVQSADDAISSKDLNGIIQTWNMGAEKIFGYTAEEIVGRHISILVPPGHADEILQIIKRISLGEHIERYETVRMRKDGTLIPVSLTLSPIKDGSGSIVGVSVIAHDITARKAAEDALQNAFDEIKKLKDQFYKENLVLREEIDKASMFEEIVGASPALKAVLARVAKVAPTDSTVFITGETGTGKELVARAIHKRSQRSSQAFVSVNCSSIPATLVASELFGHEKGAFTGAFQRRLGRFELAEGGTIFLDEIGELPGDTQIALLRVLQEHEFERVGGNQAIRANVRVIAATNRDMKAAIEAGIFRSDLFYRLNVFPIEMPSLRERKEDIPILVEYFIARYAGKAGKKIRGISRKTLDMFQSYPWPGNIRELQNVIERSVILCDTESFSVDQSWLVPESNQTEPAILPLSGILVTQEKEMIESALAESRGRVSGSFGAAAKLGMPPSTLESKIRSLKINKHRFKPV